MESCSSGFLKSSQMHVCMNANVIILSSLIDVLIFVVACLFIKSISHYGLHFSIIFSSTSSFLRFSNFRTQRIISAPIYGYAQILKSTHRYLDNWNDLAAVAASVALGRMTAVMVSNRHPRTAVSLLEMFDCHYQVTLLIAINSPYAVITFHCLVVRLHNLSLCRHRSCRRCQRRCFC